MNDDIVVDVVRTLNHLHVPYMVTGALACNAYGFARSTFDADFVIALDRTPIEEIALALAPKLRLDPQISFEAIASFNTRYQFVQPNSEYRVDFFAVSDEPYDRERFSRRRMGMVGDTAVFIPSAEDVIITKLRWARNRTTSNDRDDARNVIAVQRDSLDWPYIDRWCSEHGTLDLLESIKAELRDLGQF